ncbi:hypothetical protein JCM1840_005578 [Sporobolomyces johnsonii]
MLDTLDLANGFFGYWALGMAVWLFAPAFWQNIKEKPLTVDNAAFFAWWLAGDFLQLVALLLTGAAITQVVLYIIVATLETLLLTLLCFYAGIFTVKFWSDLRKRRREDEQPEEESILDKYRVFGTVVAALHTHDPITELGLVKEPSGRKEFIMQATGVLAASAVSLGVWAGVDYSRRHTADPNPVATWPDSTLTWVAYVLGWIGLVCWVAPRATNIYLSSTKRYPDPIDTSTVVVGAMTHAFNITSILILNHTPWSMAAQAPFILTSVICLSLDFVRLWLKHHYRYGSPLSPWDDPNYLSRNRHKANRRQKANQRHKANRRRADEEEGTELDDVARRDLATHARTPSPRDPKEQKRLVKHMNRRGRTHLELLRHDPRFPDATPDPGFLAAEEKEAALFAQMKTEEAVRALQTRLAETLEQEQDFADSSGGTRPVRLPLDPDVVDRIESLDRREQEDRKLEDVVNVKLEQRAPDREPLARWMARRMRDVRKDQGMINALREKRHARFAPSRTPEGHLSSASEDDFETTALHSHGGPVEEAPASASASSEETEETSRSKRWRRKIPDWGMRQTKRPLAHQLRELRPQDSSSPPESSEEDRAQGSGRRH